MIFRVVNRRFSFAFVLALCSLLVVSTAASAQSASVRKAVAVEPAGKSQESRAGLIYSPLNLRGGSTLTMVSPHEWSPVASQLSESLKETHEYFTGLFGEIPSLNVAIHLMEEEAFYQSTGAPRWTNALYHREKITIPLSRHNTNDIENLKRSIAHEYTHAVVHSLSAGEAPGWLDEGLAQWVEGKENPALRPALINWLNFNQPVPLRLLQGGFTRLEAKMVPAAYAQSLFGANHIINNNGFERIRGYFDSLRKGEGREAAFKNNFSISEKAFEEQLGRNLAQWHRHYRHRSLIH